jgi:glycine/D-amino acid oxidase-like deaminating enzyme
MRAFPIKGGLLQKRGGTVRHDAVAWGYARGADQHGVDIIQQLRGDRHSASRRFGGVIGVSRPRAATSAREGGLSVAGNSSSRRGDGGLRCRSKAMCCRPSCPKA